MKRLLCAALTAILALPALCGAMAEAADVLGDWYLSALEINGITFPPDALDIDLTVTLNADGSAVLTFSSFGEEASYEGSWAWSGDQIVIDDGSDSGIACTLSEGKLIAAEEGGTFALIFDRGGDTSTRFEPGAVRGGTKLADFSGRWTATLVETGDVQIPAALAGITLEVTVRGANAEVYWSGAGVEVRYTARAALSSVALHIPGDPGKTFTGLNLRLHESGVLSDVAESDGATIVLYLQRAD